MPMKTIFDLHAHCACILRVAIMSCVVFVFGCTYKFEDVRLEDDIHPANFWQHVVATTEGWRDPMARPAPSESLSRTSGKSGTKRAYAQIQAHQTPIGRIVIVRCADAHSTTHELNR